MIGEKSLRFRLFAAWGLFLLLTLQPAALGLTYLFERSLTRSTLSELDADIRLIAESLDFDASGTPNMTEAPTHPRFLLAYGGRYWQVSDAKSVILRSPSLWGQTLAAPNHPSPGAPPAVIQFAGPSDQHLLGLVQRRQARTAPDREIEIITAVDQAEILNEVHKFWRDLVAGVAGFAMLFLMAASLQILIGLAPLLKLRSSLAAVHNGSASRIVGEFPEEVRPLVHETNALLKERDEAIEMAQARAGNLAHGLKTPLAIMATQSRLIRRAGLGEFSDEIDKQIEQMRWHVERELVLARDRAGPVTRQRLNSSVQLLELVNALKKLPRGELIQWDLSIQSKLLLTMDRADFTDIMGNILENALKWSETTISVHARRERESVSFTFDDDGPGVKPEQLPRLVLRGERADQSVPGSGLGLAIVNELVNLHGGQLELSRSPLGGLHVAVTVPSAQL